MQSETLTIRDNRTGTDYSIPITDGAVSAYTDTESRAIMAHAQAGPSHRAGALPLYR